MRRVICACWIVLLSTFSFAGIVDDVRLALAQQNFSGAESALNAYKAKSGVTPEYVEALSWMGRAALADQQYAQAEKYARQTQTLAAPLIKGRSVDSDEHLATAVGAAYEVQAQALAGQGQKTQAMALLRTALRAYGNTSIASRLQKNLNLLSLVGQLAPALKATEYLGAAPPSAAQLKGTPQLLFFWAHWCADCKGEASILTRLRSEFKELAIIAPTQRYGYAERGDEATPQAELAYIKNVWQQYYPGLQGVPVPVNKTNFTVYGSSTTPTLVLIDRRGRIAYYHPGAVPYDELRSAIEKVLQG
ncbi:MAG TPA: TlpA disulfide reductase family protein [Terriglobales bacterium]|nr:TlpA disulfide reductase family protein [Terriglobales bacterium]